MFKKLLQSDKVMKIRENSHANKINDSFIEFQRATHKIPIKIGKMSFKKAVGKLHDELHKIYMPEVFNI